MQGFGELEAALMELLWQRGEPTTVREALSELRWHRELAYTTVLTVVDTLFRKGLAQSSTRRSGVSLPAGADKDQYVARTMHEALVDSGDHTKALTHFVGRMTLDEAAALHAALSEFERRISGR